MSITYYAPLRSGANKTYFNDYNNFACDHGSGLESHTKFADSIYFHAADALYVNLFIASALSCRRSGVCERPAGVGPRSPAGISPRW